MIIVPRPKEEQSETVALFISDLHLDKMRIRTTEAFFDFLQRHAVNAQRLYFLGDLFEYWAGDDDLAEPYNTQVVKKIREVSDSGVKIFWIAGNRDFLAGEEFFRAAGVTSLPDPFVADIAGQRIALTHGDAQCTGDVSYSNFRKMVRQPDWQIEFLTMPLAQRKAIIEKMRVTSQQEQRTKAYELMDVNASAIQSLFKDTRTSILIHGHTHLPATHRYGEPSGHSLARFVLPDWENDDEPRYHRGGWLALLSDGTIRRFNFDAKELSC